MDEQTRLDLAYAVIGRQKIEIEELVQQWNEQRDALVVLKIEHARMEAQVEALKECEQTQRQYWAKEKGRKDD